MRQGLSVVCCYRRPSAQHNVCWRCGVRGASLTRSCSEPMTSACSCSFSTSVSSMTSGRGVWIKSGCGRRTVALWAPQHSPRVFSLGTAGKTCPAAGSRKVHAGYHRTCRMPCSAVGVLCVTVPQLLLLGLHHGTCCQAAAGCWGLHIGYVRPRCRLETDQGCSGGFLHVFSSIDFKNAMDLALGPLNRL